MKFSAPKTKKIVVRGLELEGLKRFYLMANSLYVSLANAAHCSPLS
jgi:hypothetical protein